MNELTSMQIGTSGPQGKGMNETFNYRSQEVEVQANRTLNLDLEAWLRHCS